MNIRKLSTKIYNPFSGFARKALPLGLVFFATLSTGNPVTQRKFIFETAIKCVGKSDDDGVSSYRKVNVRPAYCCDECGEDAYFQFKSMNTLYLGVADGVGGWADHGVDAALFSWNLMDNCKKALDDAVEAEIVMQPNEILDAAYSRLLDSKEVKMGSSTAIIATLDESTGKLLASNIGDSGLVVVRNNKVVFHTPEQQHFFNAPFQLSVMPAYMKKGSFLDKPKDAENFGFDLIDGDLVILASDGFFDNFYDRELEEELDHLLIQNSEISIKDIVEKLMEKTLLFAHSEKRKSPFAASAAKHGFSFLGGKVDDITIALIKITQIKQ